MSKWGTEFCRDYALSDPHNSDSVRAPISKRASTLPNWVGMTGSFLPLNHSSCNQRFYVSFRFDFLIKSWQKFKNEWMNRFLNKSDHSPSPTRHLDNKTAQKFWAQTIFVRNFPSVRASLKDISKTNIIELEMSQAQTMAGSSLSQSDFQRPEIIWESAGFPDEPQIQFNEWEKLGEM